LIDHPEERGNWSLISGDRKENPHVWREKKYASGVFVVSAERTLAKFFFAAAKCLLSHINGFLHRQRTRR
jgi:hypothetical protein